MRSSLMVPSMSDESDASKSTGRGASPDVGAAVMSAVGVSIPPVQSPPGAGATSQGVALTPADTRLGGVLVGPLVWPHQLHVPAMSLDPAGAWLMMP